MFALHNFAYTNPRLFANVDYCLVASEFARRHYRDKVGLDCQALSYPVDWDRVRVENRDPRFVTFVNPCLEKGVYAFARIAHELGRRRPDIPLLVVESRGTKEHLAACGLDLAAAGNIQIMPHTTDPRRFWRLTKIALMPSLWWENQPLVAIEAMINGIPVIGSDRGGIPETVGDGGVVLPLPERLTPATRIVPEAEEVEPWVEAIIRLWDDPSFLRGQSELPARRPSAGVPTGCGRFMRSSSATSATSPARPSYRGLMTARAASPTSHERDRDSANPTASVGTTVVRRLRLGRRAPQGQPAGLAVPRRGRARRTRSS